MFSFNLRSRTLGVELMLICSALFSSVAGKPGKQASEILATFGQPVQIFGDMIRNDIDFVDGLKVNVYSPTNKTLTIEQNDTPLSGAFTTGTTGTNFRLARGYSYKFTTDSPSNDLIAQIAIPYDPTVLSNRSLVADNTFVGQLAGDKKAWIVVDADRTVQTTQFRTAMSQMTSLDGEYVILARNSKDTGNIFMEYGEGDQFSANFTGGPGRQDVEFMDGLRFAVQTDRPLRMNVQLKFPIAPEEIPQGMISLNSYAWVVNSTVNALIDPPAPPPAVPGNNTRLSTIGAASTAGAASTGVPAATTIPIPQFPNSVQPAISSSPFVYAQPKNPRRIRRSPADAMPIPGFGNSPDNRPGPNGPGPNGPGPNSPGPNGPGPNGPFRGQEPGPPGMGSLMPPNPSDAPPFPFVNAPAASSMPASMPGMTMPIPSSLPAPGPTAPPTPIPPPAAPSAPPPPPGAAPADVQAAQIQFPINMNILQSRLVPTQGQGNANPALAPLDLNSIAFTIGRRDANSPANTMFTPMTAMGNGTQGVNAAGTAAGGVSVSNGRLVFDSRTMLDGEYIILVPVTQGLGGAAPAKQGEGQPAAAAKAKGQTEVQKASDATAVRSSVTALVGAFIVCALIL